MPATPARRGQRRPDPGSAAAGRGRLVAVGGVVIGLAGLGLWLALRRDPAADLIDRQRALMTAAGPLRSADVDGIIRTADRLSRDDIREVRAAIGGEWHRLEQQSIDRYFAAAAPQRPALLDEDIARLRKYHALLAALNPHDAPGMPVRAPRRPKRDPDDGPAEALQARRELERLYDAARTARATARGITLPRFR